MKKVTSLLPALGLVLGATMALAFSLPQIEDEPAFGQDPLTGIWYDVTDETPGANTYDCDELQNSECLYDAPFGLGSPISEPNRVFVKNGDLEEAV
ncbi:hypothetical protein MM239_20345 [Belliella sp. DSM 111904]|uniref:Uncharacterized protein n=1 Tax=Belliella filtrata TaxID=2923435 RepID=A0ABS9V5U5_9BACT|nr:hypothetical protein [Belliella filtrata]MCH7411748.1 hypothetical protein [Belliella filtrata]